MRLVLLLLAAGAVLLGIGWFLLGGPAPTTIGPAVVPGTTVAPGGSEAPPLAGPGGSATPGAPGSATPRPPGTTGSAPHRPPRDPSLPPPRIDPDSLPAPLTPPLPEGDFGEIVRTDLSAEDREKVEAQRVRLIGIRIGEADWRSVGLRKVLDRLSEKAGIPFEIEGEGLDEEPVVHRVKDDSVMEAVRTVTTRLKLRFEVRADRVIVKR